MRYCTFRATFEGSSQHIPKILVCDCIFAALGSFNWLSYRGEQDKEYRNETSILLRDPASVTELARITLREWHQ